MRKSSLAVSALTLALVTGLITAAGGMPSDQRSKGGHQPVVIAIGDSFASGEGGQFAGSIYNFGLGVEAGRMAADYGAHAYNDNVFYHDTFGNPISAGAEIVRCHRSDTAEINQVAAATDFRGINLACSGARTADVRNRSQHGQPPQIDQLRSIAINPAYDIQLIVVSIGGNDMGFEDILADCIELFTTGSINCGTNGSDARVRAGAAGARPLITATLNDISAVMRDSGYPDGSYSFVYQGPPNLFAGSKDRRTVKGPVWQNYKPQSPGVPMSNGTVDWTRSMAQREVNRVMREAAAAADNPRIQFLDLTRAFSGHELSHTATTLIRCDPANISTSAATCRKSPAPAAATGEWVVPLDSDFVLGSLLETARMAQTYHPNRFGQVAIGTCVAEAMSESWETVYCQGRASKSPQSNTISAK